MSFNDPLADMLTRIRNGQMAKLATIIIPFSKLHEGVLKVLEQEGYIKSFSVEEVRKNIKQIKVALSYHRNAGVIKKINKVTKPGLRVYYSVEQLKANKFYSGLGIYIVSTSKGIMSDKDAKKLNIGGEVLCNVY